MPLAQVLSVYIHALHRTVWNSTPSVGPWSLCCKVPLLFLCCCCCGPVLHHVGSARPQHSTFDALLLSPCVHLLPDNTCALCLGLAWHTSYRMHGGLCARLFLSLHAHCLDGIKTHLAGIIRLHGIRERSNCTALRVLPPLAVCWPAGHTVCMYCVRLDACINLSVAGLALFLLSALVPFYCCCSCLYAMTWLSGFCRFASASAKGELPGTYMRVPRHTHAVGGVFLTSCGITIPFALVGSALSRGSAASACQNEESK